MYFWFEQLRNVGSSLLLSDYESALDSFTCSIELNQNPVEGYLYRGFVYRDKADYDQALIEIGYALELDPDNALAYANRGSNYFRQGAYQQAIENYNIALTLNSENNEIEELVPRLYLAIASAYTYLGRYDEALVNSNQSITLDPESGLAYAGRGFIYAALGDTASAQADWDTAIKLDVTVFKDFLRWGVYLFDLGSYGQAIEMYSQGIQLAPDDALGRAYWLRGSAYAQLEEHTLALADFDQAIEYDPWRAEFYYERGLLHVAQENHELAIQDFTQAIELDPTLANAYNNRAFSYMALGETELAQADWEHYSASVNPDIAMQNLAQGNAYLEAGDYDTALTYFLAAMVFNPELAEAYLGWGHVAYAQEDFPAALEAYEMYLELASEDADPAIIDRVEELK